VADVSGCRTVCALHCSQPATALTRIHGSTVRSASGRTLRSGPHLENVCFASMSSHRAKRLGSRCHAVTLVTRVTGDTRGYGSQSRLDDVKTGGDPSSGISLGDVLRLPKRHPACRRREAQPGLYGAFDVNLFSCLLSSHRRRSRTFRGELAKRARNHRAACLYSADAMVQTMMQIRIGGEAPGRRAHSLSAAWKPCLVSGHRHLGSSTEPAIIK
jgi:hypothetical protein